MTTTESSSPVEMATEIRRRISSRRERNINLFVDHKKRFETANLSPTSYKFLDVSGKDDEVGGSVVDTGEAELSIDDTEDSDYNFDKKIGSDEEFLSDGEYDSDFTSDDEQLL
ncbi:hypothetical protein POM88_038364 [Heracleum sosnowskyi]|uniref:Uncharacterized protein n=1 Tax=Heracleum sosnowskyi TaxID=360622 RepID=A0AAD8HAP6_9APIA|nr:hypothetical protein POM88_038364 [Heracleum sosnowskyi]